MLLGSSHCCHICRDGLQAWMNQTVGFFLLLGSPEQAEENHVTEGGCSKVLASNFTLTLWTCFDLSPRFLLCTKT